MFARAIVVALVFLLLAPLPIARPAPAADATVSKTFFATDFEHGLTGWTVTQHAGSATCGWQIETQRARSPTHGVQCGDGSSYADGSDTDLVSPTIDLSNAKSASLSFYEYANGEAFLFGLFVYDYGTVSVSGDGGSTWTDLDTYVWSVPQWTNDTLDLSQASGVIGSANVKLKFNWQSDSSVHNNGWFIDDLKVWGSADGATVPGAPSGLTATGGDTKVSLSWTAPTDGGSAITDYKIYRGKSSGGEVYVADTGGANTSYVDTAVANGVTYYYEVSAVNAIGEGAKSAEASATPTSGGGGGETEVTCHVFATREGLVGGTTANGHTIVSHDHFVALPSPRALGTDGGHEFMVTIKNPANGDTATEPVWDTGPWNTKDDYWAPATVRESWTDLPQCKPEAQAAYQDGYNGGQDQFGRTVTNPAGIDLADGTFWDSLGMTDNGWVDVTFRWTAPSVTVYQVTSSGSLNVRTGPGTSYATEGTVPSGSLVASFDASSGWPSFSYAAKPGWSSGSYLASTTGGTYAEVTVEGASMRSGPGSSYSQLGTTNWPEKFVLTSNSANAGCGSSSSPWCEVWWDGQKAWIDAHADASLHAY
ncbi:MAG: fibronectin type III domain-containing protein [Thermoplasmatota archaeon]